MQAFLIKGPQALCAGNLSHLSLRGVDRNEVRNFSPDRTKFHQGDAATIPRLTALRATFRFVKMSDLGGQGNLVRRENTPLLGCDRNHALALSAEAADQALRLRQCQRVGQQVGRDAHGDETADRA